LAFSSLSFFPHVVTLSTRFIIQIRVNPFATGFQLTCMTVNNARKYGNWEDCGDNIYLVHILLYLWMICLIWFFGSCYGLVLVLVAFTNSQPCEIIIHLFLWILPVPFILCHCKRFFDHLYRGQTRGWKALFKETILIVKQKLQGESWRAIVVGPFCLKHFSFSFVSGKWGVCVPFQLHCFVCSLVLFPSLTSEGLLKYESITIFLVA